MGTLVLEPALPDHVKEELHGEPVLFSVREGRLISRGGAIGGAVVGAGVTALGAFALSSRGDPNVTIDLFGIFTTADTAEGSLLLLIGGALAIAAGLGMLVASPILRRMPGGIVVGTQTRILHAGRWRVHSASWRDVESVSLDKDGSVALKRHYTGDRTTRSLDIVEPPQGAALVALIAGLIDPKKANATSTSPPTDASIFKFRSTHTSGMDLRPRLVALAIATVGLLVALLFVSALFSGGSITASTNGGPVREVGPGDLEAWIPVLIGTAVAAGASLVFYLGRPRPTPVDYFAEDDQLTVNYPDGTTTSVAWRVFTGDVRRREGRRGTVLEFPLRTYTRASDAGRSQRQVIRMVGVQNADEVLAVIRPRIA